MFIKGYVDILGNDSEDPWDQVHVNEILFHQVDSQVLLASPANPPGAEQQFIKLLRSSFMPLSGRALYRRLVALQFHLESAERPDGSVVPVGRGDVRLADSRTRIGLTAVPGPPADVFIARDEIVTAELASGDPRRGQRLLLNHALLYAVENLIRAVVFPDYLLPHCYKAVEAIQNQMSGRRGFACIGLRKAYVDYIMERANRRSADERHAPDQPSSPLAIPLSEGTECLRRTREVISRFAANL